MKRVSFIYKTVEFSTIKVKSKKFNLNILIVGTLRYKILFYLNIKQEYVTNMPRTSKIELDFQRKKISTYLLEREKTKKTLEISERLLNSLLKAKSSARRKEYRERLTKVLQCLAVDSEDLDEERERKKKIQKKYDVLQTKHSNMFQQNISNLSKTKQR